MSCMFLKESEIFALNLKTNFLLKSLNDSNTFENYSNTFENDSNTFENNLNYLKKIDFRRRKKGTKKIKEIPNKRPKSWDFLFIT